MAQVCQTVITDYDELNNPITEEYCYDDGSIVNSDEGEAIDYTKIYDWNNNADGSQQRLNPDGSVTYRDPDGSQEYTVQRNGVYTTQSEGKTWNYDPKQSGFVDANGKLLPDTTVPSGLLSKVLNAVKANPLAALGTAYAAYKSLGSSNSGGYNVPIPHKEAISQQIDYNDPNRRPGSGGRQYSTDIRYVKEGDTASIDAAKAASDAQAQGILAAYKPAEKEVNPWAGKMKMAWNETPDATNRVSNAPVSQPAKTQSAMIANPTQAQLMDPNYRLGMATGGITALARGGQGRYLQGATDGMADKIPTSIDGDQPAALSHGEFVIPADVVSHLGNGNSDAGAKKLYQMMDRIRQARTGTKEQGKRINPDKFMPGGLAAAYAGGGKVKGFDGTTGSTVTGSGGIPLDTSKTSTLSPWAGEYVTNMLGDAEALSKKPYTPYTGPLTAGTSDLQKQGFAGLSDLAASGYKPGTFTSGTFDTAAANQYMNPYIMASLNPQMAEARRQSEISQLGNAAKAVGAGAFGGSRSALMNAESQRALGANLSNIVGTGLNTAYDKAMGQFNAEQNRGLDVQRENEKARQYSADYGLKSLNDLLNAGKTQRDIDAEGIAADKKQWEEEQARPYSNLEFRRKMLEGLPIGASTTSVNQDAISKLSSDVSGIAALYDKLAKLIPGS